MKPKRISTAAIDHHVAARIRECRVMLGLTQQQFGEIIGVSSRQVHKYERGLNRVPASSLYEIAQVLNTPITYFYDGVGEEISLPIAPRERMMLETMRYFSAIKSEKQREAFSQLARALAGGSIRMLATGPSARGCMGHLSEPRAATVLVTPPAQPI